jgi:hypothetical protein
MLANLIANPTSASRLRTKLEIHHSVPELLGGSPGFPDYSHLFLRPPIVSVVHVAQSLISTAMAVDSHSCFPAPTIGADDFGLGGGHSGKNAECDRSDADLRVFHCHWYFFL